MECDDENEALDAVLDTRKTQAAAMCNAEDFYGSAAAQVGVKWWRGGIILASQPQVEDPSWWREHDVHLAVSFNGGFFHSVGGGGAGSDGWFDYPHGACAVSVPITASPPR